MSDKATNLLISSSDRDLNSNANTPSNFRVQLSSNILNANKMCLVNLILPYTFYNVLSGINNQIIVNGTTYTLPPGNYSLTELLLQIQNQVQVALPSFQILYNDITSQVILTNPVSITVSFPLINLAEMLGFPQVTTNLTGAIINGVTPPNIGPLNILLNLDIGSGMNNSNRFAGSASFIIPVLVNKNEYILFSDRTHYVAETKVNSQLLNSIDVRVTDNKGRPLIGLGDWSFLLRFDHVDTRMVKCNGN